MIIPTESRRRLHQVEKGEKRGGVYSENGATQEWLSILRAKRLLPWEDLANTSLLMENGVPRGCQPRLVGLRSTSVHLTSLPEGHEGAEVPSFLVSGPSPTRVPMTLGKTGPLRPQPLKLQGINAVSGLDLMSKINL